MFLNDVVDMNVKQFLKKKVCDMKIGFVILIARIVPVAGSYQ